MTRLQQLILKNFKDGIVDKVTLVDDGFNEEFINNAIVEGFINNSTANDSYEMTDKLRYMPITFAKFKLDSKNKANKFRTDDPQLIKTTFNAAKEYHLASIILTERMGAVFE